MGNFRFLEKRDSIIKVEVLDYFNTDRGRYFKILITFKDNSTLQAKEFSGIEHRNYSFHWQDENNDLICRWDNAPHHKNIKSFPHHLHTRDKITESYSISIDDVVEYIEKEMKTMKK